MRSPEIDRLLRAVRVAVAEAREGGATVRACIWDATAVAVDGEACSVMSPEARRTADDACRAVDPPTVKADPTPRPKPPLLARALYAAADRLARP